MNIRHFTKNSIYITLGAEPQMQLLRLRLLVATLRAAEPGAVKIVRLSQPCIEDLDKEVIESKPGLKKKRKLCYFTRQLGSIKRL